MRWRRSVSIFNSTESDKFDMSDSGEQGLLIIEFEAVIGAGFHCDRLGGLAVATVK